MTEAQGSDLQLGRAGFWSEALERVRPELLDCLQTTAAVLAEAGQADSHLQLGARLTSLAPTADSDPATADGSWDQFATSAAELLGLEVEQAWFGADRTTMADALRAGGPLYVVADAFDLRWLPYVGHKHMSHSFLVDKGDTEDTLTVVDAYHNSTPWGDARPGSWQLPAEELVRSLPGSLDLVRFRQGLLPLIDLRTALTENVDRLRSGDEARAAYLEAARTSAAPDVLDQLATDCWVMARSRKLHAVWLDEQPAALSGTAAAWSQVAEWEQLATHSYLTLRRAARSPVRPDSILASIEKLSRTDLEVADLLVQQAIEWTGRVEQVVVDRLADAFRTTALEIRSAAGLRDVPGFNSFRLVDAVSSIEVSLGLRIRDEQLTSSDLHDRQSFTGLFLRARPAAGDQS